MNSVIVSTTVKSGRSNDTLITTIHVATLLPTFIMLLDQIREYAKCVSLYGLSAIRFFMDFYLCPHGALYPYSILSSATVTAQAITHTYTNLLQ